MPDEKEKERKFAKDFLEKWARAEREEGPADEALVRVDEALKAAPDDPKLWFRRASILTDLERFAEALESFRRVEALEAAFPGLFVGLSFVLTRLGRVEEAAEAQRRTLGATGLSLEPERDAEKALEALAEDLRKESTEEEAGKALEELGTIVGAEPVPEVLGKALGAEAAPDEDFEAKLARWAAAGYDVAPLREIMDQEPDRTRTAFFQFEQNIRKVEILRETVDTLSPVGLEGDIARIRDLFLAPYQIWRIEAEMATLLEKADARDRAARARVAPPPPAVRRPPGIAAPPAAVGRVNGLINGTGRVNGLARGRVNGLINGVVRARSGLTNGLTNGIGFTNGLGGPRYARDQRRRWARILFIPLVAVSLLSVTLILPPEAPPVLGGIPIDGDFREWRGETRYSQPSSVANPDVDLLEYASHFEDRHLSLYARVRGTIFPDTTAYDMLYAYVDVDGDAATGYDGDQIGAEVLVEILGGNGSVMQANTWTWSGTDREGWSGWTGGGPTVLAAALGSEVEIQLDVDAVEDIVGADAFDDERAAVRIVLDDQAGSSSESMLAFGPAPGALRVVQSSAQADDTVSASLSDFLVLALSAEGGPVNVTSATIGLGPGTPSLTPLAPVFVLPGAPPILVTLRVDATGLPAGSLLSAEVLSVEANRPVTISGGPARAYVGSLPPGPAVDGLFPEWTSVTNDTDAPAVSNPHIDIVQHASTARNATAFSYARVAGKALGDRDAPWGRSRPRPGPASAPGPPVPPERRVGEDLFRVFYDANGTAGGAPVGGIVADAYLEVRGRHGRVRQVQGYEWQGGWVPRGTAWAVADGDRIEASFELLGRDFRSAAYVIESLDWRRARDVSDASGVRGTRSAPGGVTFVGSFEAFLPATADMWFVFTAPGGLDVSWQLPTLWRVGGGNRVMTARTSHVPFEASRSGGGYRGAYDSPNMDVAYEAGVDGLKEVFVLRSPPVLGGDEDFELEFPLRHHPELMADLTGEALEDEIVVDGPLSFVDGRGLSVTFAPPWMEDSAGRRKDLQYRWTDGAVRIRVPGEWLRSAAYPVILDPTTTYTLRNDGSTYKKGENLGWSVAVGDFNGDGFADVLTGAPQNNLGTSAHGYAYIYLGPFSADRTTPDVSINGTTASAQFGFSVAAGKFNGDTYWDALIARKSLNTVTGDVDIYFGSSSFDATADVKIQPPSSPQNFGWAVAAGNVDNADFDDVVVGEESIDNDGGLPSQDGRAHVYKSPFSSTVSTANYTLFPSSNVSGHFGRAIAVGKVDSDAYADVVVGEPLANSNNGRVHLFKGINFVTGSGNRYANATLGNQASSEQFGTAISLGLLDGDAYNDLVVGAPFRDAPANNNGTAYIFLANSDGSGLSSGASPDVTIAHQSTGERFGTSLAVLDFADDGSPGIAVGAPFAAGGGTNRGRAYWFDAPLSDVVADETMSGVEDNERFGQSLAGGRFASDVRTQLAIGAYLWDKNPANPTDNDGRVVVATVPEPGDVLLLIGAATGLVAISLQRRRLIRKR